MNKKTIRTFTCRMSYDDAEHMKIMQTLDDLNLDVHKSVNKFIIEALKYYIKAVDDGFLTNEDVSRSTDYVTRTELKEEFEKYIVRIEEIKNDVKNSLYEELFKLLTGTLISSGTSLNQRVMIDGVVNRGIEDAKTDLKMEDAEDISQQLSHYDNVLSQVMSWGDI